MRKLRLTEGFTLLKVTQLVSSRVRIQIQACVNPDAGSFPLPHRRGQRAAEITMQGLTC